MKTKYLKPSFINDTKPLYSEWDIRNAWDETLAGMRFKAEVGDAFESYAFRAFLERLKLERQKREETESTE